VGKTLRSLRALAVLAVALSACGDAKDAPLAKRLVNELTAATTAKPGAAAAALGDPSVSSTSHDLYAQKGFQCDACHPCGQRSPDGHAAAWMDGSSSGFHAYSANASLASCQSCHGPALDGAGGSVSVSCAQCHGETWKNDCTECHGGTDGTSGAPPRATWGHSAELVRAGAHTAHLAATHALSKPVACASCHAIPLDALTAGHVDASPAEVSFSGLAGQDVPAGTPPGWDRAGATCSNLYCHGATVAGGSAKAPVWTESAGASRACDACHGAPPPEPHVQDGDCTKCHDGYALGQVVAATHIDGKVDVVAMECNGCHGSAVSFAPPRGTHGELLTTAIAVGAHQQHVLPGALSRAFTCSACHLVPAAGNMQHADRKVDLLWGTLATWGGAAPQWDRASATCATSYCHGKFEGGNAGNLPVWTKVDGTQAACGTCHGAPPPAPHPGNPECGDCHSGYSRTGVNVDLHVNGYVEVLPLSCNKCHGSAANAAPPNGTLGETASTTIAVGAHQQHVVAGTLSKPIACAECHVVPASTNMLHANGAVDLGWGPLATRDGAAPQWTRANATCGTSYCHGNFVGGNLSNAPVWTKVDGTQAACGTCHGAPPAAPHPGNPYCGDCHDGYSATGVNLDLHVNGAVDVLPLKCNSCHGSATSNAPPSGTLGETETNTRAVGAHQLHLTGGALRQALACGECHLEPTDVRHADGEVGITFGPLATADLSPASYDRETMTCSGVYCHGAILRGNGANIAPVWTGGQGEVVCGSCHTTPPPEPHPHTSECQNCHPGYTTTSVNLELHVNGVVNAENLTCSSCHGDNTRVLTMQADPNAIAAPPFGSRGETDKASRSVGSHQAHVNRGDGVALPNKCKYCHLVPTTFDHSDGVSQTTFSSLATTRGATPYFDRDTQTCTNTYCHGATLGRGGTNHTPSWTDPAPVTCTTCHGVPPPAPHPQETDCIRCHPGYTQTSVRKWTHVNGQSDFPSGCNSCHDIPPNSGAHYDHMQEGIACSRCHTGYTTTTANPDLHRNARQDVTLSGWNASTRTCARMCHDSEYWGRSGARARTSCNQCHGVPPRSGEHYEHSEYACSRCHGTGYSTTTTGATHMSGVVDIPYAFYNRATLSCGSGAGACHGSERWGSRSPVTPNCSNCHGFPPSLPHPQQTNCQSCHPSMTSTGVLTSSHNNGTLDIGGEGCASCHGFPPTSTRAGGTHPQDANCYGCHSTTVDSANKIVPNGTHNDGSVQVGGGGVGTYGCQTCHGDQSRTIVAGGDPQTKAAPPRGTRGELDATTRAVGAHVAHVNQTGGAGPLTTPVQCAECHPVPTSMDHASGGVNVVLGGRATLQGGRSDGYDKVSLTCASTYCHGATLAAGGTNHAPSWVGGPAEAACGTCHGAPPPAPHSQNPACGNCHDGYTGTTVNVSTHVDGNIDVSPMACTSCHGTRGAPNAAPPSGTLGETSTTALAVGAHQQHLVGGAVSGGIACSECHVVSTSMTHADGTAGVEFGALATTGDVVPQWDRTTATCASTYCHGAFPGGNLLATPSWTTVDGTQAACGSCHGAPPPPPHTNSTNCGGCHDGYALTSVNLALHVDGKLDVRPLSCNSCHGSAQNDAPPAGTQGETLTTQRAVGAHQAHLGTGTIAKPVGCNECHPVPSNLGHENGSVQLAWGTLATGNGTVTPAWNGATCASTYCHGATLAAGGTNQAPTWTKVDGTQDACGTCHGAPPPAPHSTSTGCGSCHTGYTATTVDLATHIDGKLDVKPLSCTSCHGNAAQTATAAAPLYAAPPVDTAGLANSTRVGKHQKHLLGGTYSNPFPCQTCHTNVGTYGTGHMNGTRDVSFAGAASTNLRKGSWVPGTSTIAGTCSATWCHGAVISHSGGTSGGTATKPSWTGTITSCSPCHSSSMSSLPNRHSTHSGRATCADCHGTGYTTTAVSKTLHVNGAKNVYVGGKVRSWSGTSCTTSCHGSENWF
jgi:predicted CxxxxCH...CXXCH cytochrome family protein